MQIPGMLPREPCGDFVVDARSLPETLGVRETPEARKLTPERLRCSSQDEQRICTHRVAYETGSFRPRLPPSDTCERTPWIPQIPARDLWKIRLVCAQGVCRAGASLRQQL